jgi:hypothetical protein
MKAVLDLTKAIKNKVYYNEQFDVSGTEKIYYLFHRN